MRGLRAREGVVRGEGMVRGRSGREVVKRITSHRSSSGGGPDIVIVVAKLRFNCEAAEVVWVYR